MAILAFKTSAFRNAVSGLHRHVSQEMWQDLWPESAGGRSADHVRHQRRASADMAQRRFRDCSTTSTCSRTGASAILIPKPGT